MSNRKKIGCGIGVGMLFVGFVCLIGGIVYGAMPFINWSKSLAIFGWLIPITIGIILIVIGIILLFVLCYISKRNKNSDEGDVEYDKFPDVLHQQGRVLVDSDWNDEVIVKSDTDVNGEVIVKSDTNVSGEVKVKLDPDVIGEVKMKLDSDGEDNNQDS